MKFERFEDIVAWQKSKDLSVSVYKQFESCRDFSFKDQVQRVTVSVMNNIAEGFERKTNNEFKYFLFVAKGSCGEVRSMLLLAKELELLSKENAVALSTLAEEVSKILSGLIKKL